MYKLACPKCHKPLYMEGNSYKCENNHCYDIAKKKYINLLLNPDKATNNPGDNKDSLLCRREHLNKGYYDPILNSVIDMIKKYKTQDSQILDLGCGEGYYTYGIKKQLPEDTVYGLDISKAGVTLATRYTKSDVCWIVGNSKNLPFEDHSLDFITALFTVVNKEELERCIKEDGYIIHVTANTNHLIEIKELIYDEIKVKPDTFIRLPFNVVEQYDLVTPVHINNHDDALNLLKMTPHYYHIKKERRSVLDTLESLDITIDVKITVYKV